jgi:hypothetical protein
MKKDLTELVFILDRSGSMSGLESDTIGGFNGMLSKQKQMDGECRITTILFDDEIELLHDRHDLEGVSLLTEKEYYTRGTTALIDAIGFGINKLINVQKKTDRKLQAKNVLFVIITDGMENASREYTVKKVKSMINHQQKKYDWEFIFLGANIDAVETAGWIGIDPSRAQNYHADADGVAMNFQTMNETIIDYRQGKGLSKDWKEKIDHDFTGRKKSR